MNSPITTHILDLASGTPAPGVRADLEFRAGSRWEPAGSGVTDADGRIGDLLRAAARTGTYRLTFHTAEYHEQAGRSAFHPRVTIEFSVGNPDEHYHIPLLLSPFGYSTYRGS